MTSVETRIDDVQMAVLWVIGTAKYLHGRWRQSQAKIWPLAEGTIEHAEFDTTPQGQSDVPAAHLRYSYVVSGEWYGASLTAPFALDEKALDFTLRAKGKRVSVSFNPDHPEDSTITAEQLHVLEEALSGDQSGATSAEQPSSSRSTRRFALPIAVRSMVYLSMSVTLTGFALSVFAHIAAVTGHLVFSENEFMTLCVVCFGLAIATSLLCFWLHNKEARGWHTSPRVLQYGMYFFWALTGFYWIAAFFHSAPDPLFERQAVCSILEWMYLGALFYLYPATQAREAEATIEAGYSHT